MSKYRFSDTENSLSIYNPYYFGLSSFTEDKKVLVLALFNIFNDDKTVHTHYFEIPFKDDFGIEYQSGLRASGYKNGYGIQFNYKQYNENRSGFIIFGYGNTTDPEPINNLFDKHTSYTIKIRDYYKGIENNLFCYVFVNLQITEIPNTSYISITNQKGNILKRGSILTLNDEIIIKKKVTNVPTGRYVLGISPYLNEADYDDYYECAAETDMFGEQIGTDWYPDEYYGRTIEFKFTVGIDCFENCETCSTKGLSLDDQKCTKCKYGFYFVENTNNCFSEPPDGYYFNPDQKVYSRCYDKCKTCSKLNNGKIHNCLSCYANNLFYNTTNCLDCKYLNKYVNYEQLECIDSIPNGYYVNNTQYNTIDKCHQDCLTCNKGPLDDNMNCLTCDNNNGYYLVENTNNCKKHPYPGHYLEDNILKKCYKDCLTCSGRPIINGKGKIINMNCDSCDVSKGFNFIPETKTCENPNEINDDNCPEDRPILKDNKCV